MGGFEMKPKKPFEVQKALDEADSKALSAMGKAGGRIAGKLSAQRADLRALAEALQQKDAENHQKNMLEGIPEDDR